MANKKKLGEELKRNISPRPSEIEKGLAQLRRSRPPPRNVDE